MRHASRSVSHPTPHPSPVCRTPVGPAETARVSGQAKAAPLRSASNQKRSKRRPPFHERRCKVTGRKEDRRASRCVPYRCEGDRRACVLCVCAPPPQRPACWFCSRHGSPWRRACAGAACGATTELVARHGQLQNSTVADARHLLRTTMKDVDGKQEELRELVSVRYRDFIDAADTISAMGNSARTIIGAAEHAACNPASSYRGEGGQGGCRMGRGARARDSPCTHARMHARAR